MNKFINLKNIFIFLLGGILFSGITAYAAYKIHAREVSYTPENESFQVENVNNALDELYKNSKKGELKLLDSINVVYTPKTNKYSDAVTYTVEESGNLLFVGLVNASGHLTNVGSNLISTNSKSSISLLGTNVNWTCTGVGNSCSGSFATNYIYEVKNVEVGDQLTLNASAVTNSAAVGYNTLMANYQVYKIG